MVSEVLRSHFEPEFGAADSPQTSLSTEILGSFGSGGADGGVEGAAISLKPLPPRALRGVVS